MFILERTRRYKMVLYVLAFLSFLFLVISFASGKETGVYVFLGTALFFLLAGSILGTIQKDVSENIRLLENVMRERDLSNKKDQ